ncbi:MAG TPA: DNA replication and repair protein RecF [Candidatus Saccharimonadales bacterium]|jgi:DNA replication and repair protein RecF|nr:DNA replication and repair protein RecF [Candidatus Saccharimonadales bacterium]
MITDLRLQHFRSYGDASFELTPGVNIIVGPNASGKTNVLEAVLIIATGSSYRARDSELVAFGAPWARLDADTPHGTRIVKLQTEAGEKVLKSFEIDGQKLLRMLQPRTIPTVLFEPNHLLLLSGAPDLRRTFLDDLLEQTISGYGATRRHYKRVLAHRNALLKHQPRDLHEQLFVWNLRLSELGGKIVKERAALIGRFAERMSDLYGSIAQRSHVVLLEYVTQFPVEDYESALLKKLEASVELDKLRGFTASGPHRDDLGVSIDGHPASESASRGETRTLVLALKVLELQLLEQLRDMRPILLLDDVFSELDGKRRQALTAFVADYQTFITTTDADVVVQHFTTSNIIPVAR